MYPPVPIATKLRLLICAFAITQATASAATPFVLTPEQESEVSKLIERMTLEEKLGQLTQQWGGEIQDVNPVTKETKQEELLDLARQGRVGSFLGAHGAKYTNRLQRAAIEESRMKIPLILGNDVIHGYRTIFPINLGEAATWSPNLVEQASRVAAIEASAAGTHWTFAPMVDICRDPRWGRVAEGAGEDPYLGSVMAAARVKGFQGNNLSAPDTLVACAKHFAAYGGAEGGRDYNTVDISKRTLWELHLPPFEASVDAGVGTFMSAFNEINGIPATANHYIMKRILREKWGFDGFVVSDWSSVTEMIAHGFAADPKDAAEKAILAGVDMDMSSFSYRDHLIKSLQNAELHESVVDQALRRVLRMKFALGLFDRPYVDEAIEGKVLNSDAHRKVARDVARHSMVLLKNEGRLLPISKEVKSVAVIGPLADAAKDQLGTWAAVGRPEEVVTILAGIRQRASKNIKVEYVSGGSARKSSDDQIAEAVALAKKSDLALLIVGETEDMSGEAHCRSTLDLPGRQLDLVKAIHATGKPTVVVLVAGRPLSTPWIAKNIPAILMAWHSGVEGGNAVADIVFGDFNPCGRLPITVPRSVGQVPIYYAHKMTGRPPKDTRYTSKYIDIPWTPLYPFGFGLTYTSFAYSNLRIEPTEIKPAGEVTVSVDIRNTGDVAGVEVAQLYIRDPVACVTRPVRQLRGFERVSLKPGESKTVTFTLTPNDLAMLDQNMNKVVEPGDFHVWVGPDATRGPMGKFRVTR